MCGKIEEPTPGASRNDYVAPVEGATFSLVASSSEDNDAPTKALFDGNQLVWNSGDALNVFASSENSYEFKFAPIEGAAWNKQGNTFYTTEFTPEEGKAYDYTAVFPFESGLTMDSEGWLYESIDGTPVKKAYSLYTPEQKRNGNKAHLETMPLYGTAQATGFDIPQLTMHNAVSIIEVEIANKLSLAPMEVTKVKFSSDCISFGGEYYLNAKTGKLELKEGTGRSEVELVCRNLYDNGSHKEMIVAGGYGWNAIAVAPQTVTGTISVEVTTNQGTISATRNLNDITFNAGRIRKSNSNSMSLYATFSSRKMLLAERMVLPGRMHSTSQSSLIISNRTRMIQTTMRLNLKAGTSISQEETMRSQDARLNLTDIRAESSSMYLAVMTLQALELM